MTIKPKIACPDCFSTDSLRVTYTASANVTHQTGTGLASNLRWDIQQDDQLISDMEGVECDDCGWETVISGSVYALSDQLDRHLVVEPNHYELRITINTHEFSSSVDGWQAHLPDTLHKLGVELANSIPDLDIINWRHVQYVIPHGASGIVGDVGHVDARVANPDAF